MTDAVKSSPFADVVVICDEQTWVKSAVSSSLKELNIDFVFVTSSIRLREDWPRLKNVRQLIIYWENQERNSGAIIEEIKEIDPSFSITQRCIVLTSNPTHEDVIYFNELDVKNIFRLRNRIKDINIAMREMAKVVSAGAKSEKIEEIWNNLHQELDFILRTGNEVRLEKVKIYFEKFIERFSNERRTARYLDMLACFELINKNYEIAKDYWHQAIEKSPTFYRSYKNLTLYYMRTGQLDKALGLMERLQSNNRNNLSRLVQMGEIKLAQKDFAKAEHFFQSALERDSFCSRALNGLAEIKFMQGNYDESRKLLARSYLAAETASRLNSRGIALVVRKRYAEALEHYKKAQYVLPQHQKGPLIFFNIALCYAKWGKANYAKDYLQLALIKQPGYERANQLLKRLYSTQGSELQRA